MTTNVIFHLLLVAGVVLMALMAIVPALVEAAAEKGAAPARSAAPQRTPRSRPAGVVALAAHPARRGSRAATNPALHLPRAA